jgi:hypothetical protein
VNKILPPPWGLLDATWRLAPSHQLVGALDPPAVTSVSAPNTRSLLIFVHGGVAGPGVRPVLVQVPPRGAGGQGGLGSSRFLAGFRPARTSPAGGGGAPEGAVPARGKKAPQKAGTDPVWRPLSCPCVAPYCGALANHRAKVECVTGRTEPPWSLRRCRPCGGIWPFGDLATGAHQLVLVLVP